MQTVLRTLERGYSKISVKEAGIDLSDEEKSDGISEMNAMMWEHDADGLGVGWSDISSVNDVLPVPDWAISFVENGFAIRMAPEFGRPIDPSLIAMYEQALRVVQKNNVVIPDICYPNILPVGGDRTRRYRSGTFFIDQNKYALKAGTQGFIKDEEGTIVGSEEDRFNADRNQ
jgi:hypothetical protein